MSGFLRPDPALLALLSLQTFFYLPLLVLLALCRAAAGAQASRYLALLALLIALIGVAAHFGPPLLQLSSGPLPIWASQLTRAVSGMALPLAASLPLLLSAFVPGRRWWLVDWLHWLVLLPLLGLFAYARFS